MNVVLIGNTDIAELALWAFTLFFIGLILYLRREDQREGYPLESDTTGQPHQRGFLFYPTDKAFIMPHGHGVVVKPGKRGFEKPNPGMRRLSPYSGAPSEPTGNPLIDGVGPAAWAERAHVPDLTMEGHPKIVPIDQSHGFRIAKDDRDPRGMPVFGCDDVMVGVVSNVWVDQSDRLIRYLEVRLVGDAGAAGRTVLAPMFMSQVNRRRGTVKVDAITAAQFADVPAIESDRQITLYEEERVQAYYGGGYLYAKRSRIEPFL